MSTNTTNSVPGLLLPTQKAMPAGTPGESVITQINASNQKLLALQSIGGSGRGKGRRLRKKYGGATTTGTIPVPQFNVSYTPQGGPGQDPNSIIKQNAGVGTQAAANAVYDKYATQNGGQPYVNTNTNQYQWGCYSGGKKYKRSGMKLSKKKRTKRRSVRKGKSGKSRKNRKF